MLLVFGILSGVLSAIGYALYLRDTYNGVTQPKRASWLIWSLLGSIALVSQMLEGAGVSVILTVVQVVGTIAVFMLSVQMGTGGFFHKKDTSVVLLALLGILLWFMTDSAVYALLIIIGVNLLAGVVTMKKAYAQPETETMRMWLLAAAGAAFGVLSVGAYDWVVLAYPLYLLVLNTGICVSVVLGRRQRSQGLFAR